MLFHTPHLGGVPCRLNTARISLIRWRGAQKGEVQVKSTQEAVPSETVEQAPTNQGDIPKPYKEFYHQNCKHLHWLLRSENAFIYWVRLHKAELIQLGHVVDLGTRGLFMRGSIAEDLLVRHFQSIQSNSGE